MLEIAELSKYFHSKPVVLDMTFGVAPGEVLGFLGPNGAGKSTTMKMITGFLNPSSGDIRFDGCSILDRAVSVKRRLGYLPEGAPLYEEMTTCEFLDFICHIRGLVGLSKKRAIAQVVADLALESVWYQTIDTLSKGFRRRVGLAQAIVHDPDFLILDEPTDGLDPNQKHEVRAIIQKLAARKKTIILSTHILEEVDAVCSRAIIVAGGRMIADATPAELRSLHAVDSLDVLFRKLTAGEQQRT